MNGNHNSINALITDCQTANRLTKARYETSVWVLASVHVFVIVSVTDWKAERRRSSFRPLLHLWVTEDWLARGADAYANVKPLFPHATTVLMSSHKSPHSRPPPSGTCQLIETISSVPHYVYFKLHTQNGHYSFPHSDISVPLVSSWSYGPGLSLITREQAANGLLSCSPIHHPTLLPPPRPNLPLPTISLHGDL